MRGTTVLLVAGSVVSGAAVYAMNQLIGNPIAELYGPAFLILYALACLADCRARPREPTARRPGGAPGPDPDLEDSRWNGPDEMIATPGGSGEEQVQCLPATPLVTQWVFPILPQEPSRFHTESGVPRSVGAQTIYSTAASERRDLEQATIPPTRHDPEQPPPTEPITSGPEPGQVFGGKYLVVKLLGHGAMGAVWLVHHRELGRLHALKVIVFGPTSHHEALARFQREFRVMAAFHHQHAVAIHDARLDHDGGYIDMEYIDGQTLRAVLETARAGRQPRQPLMPLGWTLRILDQLCAALQVAHEQAIVHRDLKPANLMLLRDCPRGQEQLKVLDFGIAKVRDDPDNNIKTLGFIGTPTYSSPEQALGLEVDGRSDLYAVGAMLYEFLTGRPPFRGSGPTVMYQHVHEPPPAFAAIDPELGIAPAIETAVRRFLAKRPAERPPTPRDLFEEFRQACGSGRIAPENGFSRAG